MKKRIVLLLVAFAIASATVVLAEDMPEGKMGEGAADGGGMMMDKSKMMGHMRHEMEEMHEMMGKSSMVASNDGGVIVLMGHKLFKYDKDLNLVKEVELKMDKMMEGKEGGCPMCGKMMGKGDMMNKDEKGAAQEAPAPEADHEAHH